MTKNVCAAMALAPLLLGAVSAVADDWRDPYVTGDPALYPQPVPIQQVERATRVPRHASLAGVPIDTKPLTTAASKAVRIELLKVVHSTEIAGEAVPEGYEAVILVTRWINVHPKQKLTRDQAAGKADRTMGAGGLFGGATAGAKQTVDVDVPYRVEKPLEHTFLAADGIAAEMHTASASLPDGLSPDSPFTLARHGESRIQRLAFVVPKQAANLALRFLDNANGSITLGVSGDPGKALDTVPTRTLDHARLGSFEIATTGIRFEKEHSGVSAPEGWRFAAVDVLGRNQSAGATAAKAKIDPTRFAWLTADHGALWYGLPPASGEPLVSFTPGMYQRRELVFLVPETASRFRLGLRDRNGAVSLKTGQEDPAPMPKGAIEHADGTELTLSVFGQRWESNHLILDLGVRPKSGGAEGIELGPAEQFLLVAGGKELKPDPAMSQRLSRRAPKPLVVPPSTPLRFELAYPLPANAMPEALRYRGLSGDARLDLKSLATQGQRGQVTADGLTDFPVFVVKAVSSEPEGKTTGVTAAPASQAVELPPYDPSRAGEDQEPNNNVRQAQPLGPERSIRGTLSANDPDFFVFEVEDAQMWVLEAQGPGVGRMAYIDATGWPQGERAMEAGSDTLWLDNLYLRPGRHWIALHGSSAGGAFTLRAVPLGPPTPGDEREPNNDETRAHTLHFDTVRRGLIAHTGDRDFYRFNLEVPSHIALRLKPPAETKFQLRLDGGPRSITGGYLTAPGEPIVYEAELPAGDYVVQIASDGRSKSRAPYTLTLDLLDPFALPADLEPNDTPGASRPLGVMNSFEGNVGDTGDSDWFQLSPVTRDTALNIILRSEGNHARASLKRAAGKNTHWETLKENYERRMPDGHVYDIVLKAGETYLLGIDGRGDYRVDLQYTPDTGPTSSNTAIPPDLQLSGELPVFAAYRDEAQAVELPIKLRNRDTLPHDYRLRAWSSSHDWSVQLPAAPLQLGPGESGELKLRVTAQGDVPDTNPATLFVHAADNNGGAVSRSLPVTAACAVRPLEPVAYRPVPPALRGGVNLASTALGAELVTDPRYTAVLFDGLVALGGEWRVPSNSLPVDVTIRLAGDGSSPIAGLAITPAGGNQEQLGPFSVHASRDGKTFTEVFRGKLAATPFEQYFVFDHPVEARVVTLRLEPTQAIEARGNLQLSEVKIVADPNSNPLGANGLNITAPERGGHVVRALPQASGYQPLHAMLSEKDDRPALNQQDPTTPIEWVLGFRDNRAARITELQWREQTDGPNGRRLDSMEVWGSVDSPLGPWQSLGVWQLNLKPGESAAMRLEKPVWVRYLRFAHPTTYERVTWLLPETLRVLEQPADEHYRSVLGEWGLYAQTAAYEDTLASSSGSGTKSKDAGDNREQAFKLAANSPHIDSVSVGEDEDWYEIQVPASDNRLELVLSGSGAGRLVPLLTDSTGAKVPVKNGARDNGDRLLLAEVKGGERYYLHVTEPPRSIMVAWDNSGSVQKYLPAVYRALDRFFEDIHPGREKVNLMPFRDTDVRTLVEDWTDDAHTLRRALNDYNRADGSSNAEATMTAALRELDDRPGNRAIVLLTDAASNGFGKSDELWRELERLRPGIFALELHLQAPEVDHYQDLMQDWAAAARGRYSFFRTQADLDQAFARAACLIRRPAEYSVNVALHYEKPPAPGTLSVKWEKGKAVAGANVELILDASGSMRSRKNLIDGKLKIDVAKDVLRELVADLPDDVNVGLRAYGHRVREGQPGDCTDSELMAEIEPLDRAKLLSKVDSLKALGTTPIAYSLRAAASDLAKIDGPKMILLVTDGEEECKGDPAATIAELRQQGLDIKLNVAGFALAGAELKKSMEAMAAAGGGAFFDGKDRKGLSEAMARALAVPFDLIDSEGEVVGSGMTGEGVVQVPAGRYTVNVHTAKGDILIRDVEIRAAASRKLRLRREGGQVHHAFEE